MPATVKRIVKGGELVFFPLAEGGWGCGVLSGYIPGENSIVVSYGDCERVVSTNQGAAMASPRSFMPEAGYLVGRTFKDETEIAKELMPLLRKVQ